MYIHCSTFLETFGEQIVSILGGYAATREVGLWRERDPILNPASSFTVTVISMWSVSVFLSPQWDNAAHLSGMPKDEIRKHMWSAWNRVGTQEMVVRTIMVYQQSLWLGIARFVSPRLTHLPFHDVLWVDEIKDWWRSQGSWQMGGWLLPWMRVGKVQNGQKKLLGDPDSGTQLGICSWNFREI